MLILPLFCLLSWLPAAQTPQDSAPDRPGRVKQQAPRRQVSPAFDQRMRQWNVALADYRTALITYNSRNATIPEELRDKQSLPKHPAREFFASFREIGNNPDPDALQWVVEYARFAFDDAQQRSAAVEQAFADLLKAAPDSLAVEGCLDSLRGQQADLGFPCILRLCRTSFERSTNAETKARALVLEAWALTQANPSLSAEVTAQIEDLYNSAVVGFPRTRAAVEAAGFLLPRADRQHLEEQLRWVEAVRAQISKGEAPQTWPKQPIHACYERYLVLAAAGHPQAQGFVSRHYPAFQQAERNGLAVGLVWLSAWIGEQKLADPNGWSKARLGLVGIITRQWKQERYPVGALVDLSRNPLGLDLAQLEAAFEPLMDGACEPRAHARALYLLAIAHANLNDWAHWQKARALLEQLAEQHPTDEIMTQADTVLQSMIQVWPGNPAPDFRGTDADGRAFTLADYRGRVVLVDFVDREHGLTAPELAARHALLERFEKRPFSMLGGLLERHSARSYQEQIAPLGIRWRMTILGGNQHDISANWSVQVAPATFLVDAQGIIRARNLPWPELAAEIERCLAELPPK